MTEERNNVILNRTYIRKIKREVKDGNFMAISYNGLWKILIDNGMKKGDLKRRTGISSGTIAKMTNGEAVTLTVLEKICNEFNCDIGDLVEIDTFKEKKVGEEKDGKR